MVGTILHCRIVPECGQEATGGETKGERALPGTPFLNTRRPEIPNLTDVSTSGKVWDRLLLNLPGFGSSRLNQSPPAQDGGTDSG